MPNWWVSVILIILGPWVFAFLLWKLLLALSRHTRINAWQRIPVARRGDLIASIIEEKGTLPLKSAAEILGMEEPCMWEAVAFLESQGFCNVTANSEPQLKATDQRAHPGFELFWRRLAEARGRGKFSIKKCAPGEVVDQILEKLREAGVSDEPGFSDNDLSGYVSLLADLGVAVFEAKD